MEYVRGQMLAVAWDGMDVEKKRIVMRQLKSYMKELREITAGALVADQIYENHKS